MLVRMFGNRDFSSFWNVPFATFEVPLEEKGIIGVSILKQVISTGSYAKTKHVLQSKLIPRQSSRD
ncbi:hypothetical protein [uncultured Sphaerochaeta sp.]|uniref:hypothetical protein n=1 Tax=uncultured Sphaerochaeta sp. TaxID=886478 RepID=UPI002A0A71A7|nr:hypothetical protein [uncultured Sphaerochaeta sp.]